MDVPRIQEDLRMPSDPATLERVMAILPEISSRKMMGEYLLYNDGKLFGGIYDDRLLLKITKASARMLKDCPSAFPYDGGGEMILFPEPFDPELLRTVVEAMCEELPARRKRSRLVSDLDQKVMECGLRGDEIGFSP